MKRILKISYIFLLIALIFASVSSLAFNVYAETHNDTENELQTYTDYKSEIEEKSKSLDLFEIESLREENVKHFRLEDGTYKAVSYGRKVHKLNDDNNWIDFDNTLSLNNGYYKTNNNSLNFIKNINLNKPLVDFINEDYSLSLYIQSEQKLNAVEAEVENNSVFYNNIRNKTIDDLINENKNSTIKYNNICDGVSLEYFLEYDKFNTKIKIESYNSDIPIKFLVETDNVNIIVNNGSLEFYNNTENTLIKRLNKPIVNTNDEINIDLSYNVYGISRNSYVIELVDSNNNLFELESSGTRYIPDLDIDIGDDNTGPTYPTQDTYISSTSPSTNYGRYSYLKITNSPCEIALINVSVPNIPSNNTIIDAFISLPYYFNATSNQYMVVGAYSILGNWSEYNINWNNAPSISTTKICERQITCNATTSNVKTVNFDLTEISQSWYANEITNYGIAFKYERGSASSMYVKSVDANNGYPDYIISYQDDSLIKDGTYFIKNGELENFLQIDDDDYNNNYNSNNAILEMYEFDGNNYQKWEFEYLHNGYYIIKSKCSGKVISVPQGDEDDRVTLVQQPYTGSYNQQWKITLSSHGMYILKARSSEQYETNRVMCVGDNIAANGRKVKQREYENNNYYKDEWILILEMPTSGFEVDYMPNLWNTYPVYNLTNCYAYAFNTQVYPNTNNLCYMQPGYALGGGTPEYSEDDITLDLIEEYVLQDSDDLSFTFEEIGKYDVCEYGTYKVALVIANGKDYHWYRQNPNGSWSHKLGQTYVTNLDASSNIIVDPEFCDKNYIPYGGNNYVDSIKFYQISPINNFYDQSRNINSFVNIPNTELSFSNIQIGMSLQEIELILGSPISNSSSGILKLQYLNDNKYIYITYYQCLNGNFIATFINDNDGKES